MLEFRYVILRLLGRCEVLEYDVVAVHCRTKEALLVIGYAHGSLFRDGLISMATLGSLEREAAQMAGGVSGGWSGVSGGWGQYWLIGFFRRPDRYSEKAN